MFDSKRRHSDFSRIAALYDASRDLPADKLMVCYRRLMQQGVLPADGNILDAGCGTGQTSLPLIALGCQVTGIDVSKEMISVARSKLRADGSAVYAVGDVCSIPAADGRFDAAVVSKLLQHVRDWRQACRELIRVVRPDGCIVQVNERGAFGNAVRRVFSQKADALGFTARYIGLDPHAESDGTLRAFMQNQGCRSIAVDMSDLQWDMSISYREALDRLRERLFAEFWDMPDDIYQRLLAATQIWMESQPDGADTIQHLRPYLVVEAFRTPSLNEHRP